jgi:hypothetical protein
MVAAVSAIFLMPEWEQPTVLTRFPVDDRHVVPDRHDAEINDHLHGQGVGSGPILGAAAVCAARAQLEGECG